jgi:hypothetical protein
MAGQFAHICLVNAVTTPDILDSIPSRMPSIRSALENYRPFCRLGAVSPDSPAFVGSTDAKGWNGIMHYLRPADFVRVGIAQILPMSFGESSTRACIAWLFGYTAHIVADYTIHPVVAELVGPYSIKKNRKPHCRCELAQDSYIFFKQTGHEVIGTDFRQFSGFPECGVNGKTNKLNPDITRLWTDCLRRYPRQETKECVRLPNESLNPDNWFATYVNVMHNFMTKNIIPLRFLGLTCLSHTNIDPIYIENLPTPKPPQTISYDALFARTGRNIIQAWSELAQAFDQDDPSLFKLPNANLDTGKDAADNFVYWN